jgi:YgiT-type zinc finger domain-containing protein
MPLGKVVCFSQIMLYASEENIMNRCYFCEGPLVEQLTTWVYEDEGRVWIIRNVPTFVCQQCGEKEYSQETTHRLLSILKQPPRPVELVQVPAYDLAVA